MRTNGCARCSRTRARAAASGDGGNLGHDEVAADAHVGLVAELEAAVCDGGVKRAKGGLAVGKAGRRKEGRRLEETGIRMSWLWAKKKKSSKLTSVVSDKFVSGGEFVRRSQLKIQC